MLGAAQADALSGAVQDAEMVVSQELTQAVLDQAGPAWAADARVRIERILRRAAAGAGDGAREDALQLPRELAADDLWEVVKAATLGMDEAAACAKRARVDAATAEVRAADAKDWFMGATTAALGDGLEQVRQGETFGGSPEEVKVLVDGLEQGCREPVLDALCLGLAPRRAA